MNQERLRVEFDKWAQTYDKELSSASNDFPFAGYPRVLDTVFQQAGRLDTARSPSAPASTPSSRPLHNPSPPAVCRPRSGRPYFISTNNSYASVLFISPSLLT